MDLLLLRVYQRQVEFQCHCVMVAAADLDKLLKQMNAGEPFRSVNVFCCLQNVLTAAANLQKAFWGQSGKSAADRQPLRDSLMVTDDSPLHNVDMRNHFEHIDERIETWWRESPQHLFVDMNVGSAQAWPTSAEINLFRTYEPATTDAVFWGTRLNVGALVQEVQRILPLATAEAAKPHS